MHKKTLCVFFVLLLAIVIFDTQFAYAMINLPNISVSATDTFSLDLNGSSQLVTILRYVNYGDDFIWNFSTPLEIPIHITSYSEEKPNLWWLSVGDDVKNYDYSIRNYTISPRQNDFTYNHEYVIEISNKNRNNIRFPKNSINTFIINTRINGISSNMGTYNKLILSSSPLRNIKFHSYIIKVNLPNDPYHWVEILDTYPIYDYRTSFGNGESVEWRVNENSQNAPIFIDYSIHPDQTKIDLDNATKNSLYLGYIALLLTFISARIDIKNFITCLKRKFITWLNSTG